MRPAKRRSRRGFARAPDPNGQPRKRKRKAAVPQPRPPARAETAGWTAWPKRLLAARFLPSNPFESRRGTSRFSRHRRYAPVSCRASHFAPPFRFASRFLIKRKERMPSIPPRAQSVKRQNRRLGCPRTKRECGKTDVRQNIRAASVARTRRHLVRGEARSAHGAGSLVSRPS